MCYYILLNFVKISIHGPTQDNTIQKIVILNYSFYIFYYKLNLKKTFFLHCKIL